MNPARAQQLAHPAFFRKRCVYETLFMGEIQTGVDAVYGILIDSEKNSLYCTCPFQPKPCLHALALAALVELEGPLSFTPVDELPAWAADLYTGRPVRVPDPGIGAENRHAARTKRRLERLERAEAGFDDLETWLLDTLRRGIATSISEDPAFFQHAAGRLADASLRGLSRNFRLLDTVVASQPDWPAHALAVLADAALALFAFRRREQLPEALLFDLEAFIGIPLPKELVSTSGEPVRDVWAVAGVAEETLENKLQTRRTWLLGARSQRFALLLDFVYGDTGFAPGFEPGTLLDGQLVFYPSAFPQRALAPEELKKLPKKVEKLPGFGSIRVMLESYAGALGQQPWLNPFPGVLNDVIPYSYAGQFGLADVEGRSVPLGNTERGWPLVALSGGHPLSVFGEWNGEELQVWSAVTDGRFI